MKVKFGFASLLNAKPEGFCVPKPGVEVGAEKLNAGGAGLGAPKPKPVDGANAFVVLPPSNGEGVGAAVLFTAPKVGAAACAPKLNPVVEDGG